ncbi:MAG: hypothetical protein ACK5MJ_02130 [Alphaproteobacteria bacterium]
MKLAILKLIVYFMGMLLVGLLLFLGYAIYKKVNYPDWNPLKPQPTQQVTQAQKQSQEQPIWSSQCLADKEVQLNNNRIVAWSKACDFFDIFDSNGRFIYRVKLGEQASGQ